MNGLSTQAILKRDFKSHLCNGVVNHPTDNSNLTGVQCYQTARSSVKYLAIYYNKNMPNRKNIYQSRFNILANTELIVKILPKVLKNYEVVEFRQIWSHCWCVANTTRKRKSNI